MRDIRIATAAFSPDTELAALETLGAGAIGSFLGLVRSGTPPVTALTLEHYPGMTERALARIADEAIVRFALQGCIIVHRVGRMAPGERIVLAAAAAAHRHAALQATSFMIDWLKTEAPFWKKEERDGTASWIAPRPADAGATAGWSPSPAAGA